jgi:nucleotide-binding universal stress UspA family protein
MYDTILVPTDGSDGTARVAEHAIHLARQEEATLHVLHVVDTSVVPLDGHSRAIYEELEAQGRGSVATICDRANEASVHAVDAVREGEPYREILGYAEKNDVDLVVLGTHGRSGVRRALLGSVAERVVRLSPVPVLTVRTTPERE